MYGCFILENDGLATDSGGGKRGLAEVEVGMHRIKHTYWLVRDEHADIGVARQAHTGPARGLSASASGRGRRDMCDFLSSESLAASVCPR